MVIYHGKWGRNTRHHWHWSIFHLIRYKWCAKWLLKSGLDLNLILRLFPPVTDYLFLTFSICKMLLGHCIPSLTTYLRIQITMLQKGMSKRDNWRPNWVPTLLICDLDHVGIFNFIFNKIKLDKWTLSKPFLAEFY